MSPRRPVVIRPSTSQIARFGLTQRDTFGRVVIYTSKMIHVPHEDNDNSETTFLKSDRFGIIALGVDGETEPLTIDVVDSLSHYAIEPFAPYIGIRVSRSENPMYASKIVFYMKANARIEDILVDISGVMYTHFSAIASRYVLNEEPSTTEKRDRLDYDFPFRYPR